MSDKFVKSFSKEEYLIVFVDEYHLKNSIHHMKRHFMHEFLLYGINLVESYLFALGFNKHGALAESHIPINEFMTAFFNFDKKARTDFPVQNMQIIKISKTNYLNDRKFDYVEFIRQLKLYIYSQCPENEKDNVKATYAGNFYWGIETYLVLIGLGKLRLSPKQAIQEPRRAKKSRSVIYFVSFVFNLISEPTVLYSIRLTRDYRF